MTNRQCVRKRLIELMPGSELERLFIDAGFARRPRSLKFRRNTLELTQRAEIVFSTSPLGRPSALAHFLPTVMLDSADLGALARTMAIGSRAEGLVGDCIVWHQWHDLAPLPEKLIAGKWYADTENEIQHLLDVMADYWRRWVLPFFDRYRTIQDIAVGVESDDARLRLDKVTFLFNVAALVHVQRPDRAMCVLERWFGRTRLRKEYARAFEYVGQLLS